MTEKVVLAVVFGWPMTIMPNWILLSRADSIPATEIFSDRTEASPTPKTVKKLVEYAKGKKDVHVTVVVAPPHKWRVMRDLKLISEKEGVKFAEVVYDDFLNKFNSQIWYSKDSTQWWTRSKWVWWPYEILVRLLPFNYYLKLADKEKKVESRGKSVFG